MNWRGMFLGAFVAVVGAASVGCGGDSGIATTPVITIKYAGPCEAGRQIECACGEGVMGAQSCKADGSAWDSCLGCDGAGGSGGAGSSSSSGTGGEGGSTTASSTSSGSSSSSSSSSSGTGGGPCVPTLAACDPNVQCGDVDNGCGVVLKCGGCEDGINGDPNPFLTCSPVTHTCECVQASWNTEAVAFCKTEGSGGIPSFCGPPSPKAGEGCNFGGQTTTGEIVACCAP